MRDNEKTLQAYEADPQGYINKTPTEVQGDKKAWIDFALSCLSKQAKILELGSGFGRDADYIESMGFKVLRSDAAKSFVAIMKQQQGHRVLLLDALTDDYGGPYDLIYANAVLLHFSVEETKLVLQKVLAALVPGGLFALRLKEGQGSEWEGSMSRLRFMQYWLPDDLRSVLIGAGFEIDSFDVGYSKSNKFGWLQVIARRPAQ